MNDTIAIDFGTMRTKLSYIDTQRNTVELMRLGQDSRPFVPSVFFLGEDGSRLFGDDAAMYLDSHPLAFLPRPLKRELREQCVRAGNRIKATPTELLSVLFAGLRNRTKEIPCFRELPPTGLVLTIPAQYGPPDREILAKSARNAGFAEDRITFVDEPVAAAQAWLYELGGQEEFVIVLDCGGGTLDWACLRRVEGNTFEIIPELPPAGDNKVGGFDIDEAIFDRVTEKISNTSISERLASNSSRFREFAKRIKEDYSQTGRITNVRFSDDCQVRLEKDELDDIFHRRYIAQACQDLRPYLDKARIALKIEKPTVLLVGGSARLRGFKEAIEEQCRCKTVWWERSEYATVLGALRPGVKKEGASGGISPVSRQKPLDNKAKDFISTTTERGAAPHPTDHVSNGIPIEKTVLCVDVGGTSIKAAIWQADQDQATIGSPLWQAHFGSEAWLNGSLPSLFTERYFDHWSSVDSINVSITGTVSDDGRRYEGWLKQNGVPSDLAHAIESASGKNHVHLMNDAEAHCRGVLYLQTSIKQSLSLPMLTLVLGTGVGMTYTKTQDDIVVLEADKDFAPNDFDLLMSLAGCPNDKGRPFRIHAHLGQEYFRWWRANHPISDIGLCNDFSDRVRLLIESITEHYPPMSIMFAGGNARWINMFAFESRYPQIEWRHIRDLVVNVLGAHEDLIPLWGMFKSGFATPFGRRESLSQTERHCRLQ